MRFSCSMEIPCSGPMPTAYDLIIERQGLIVVETIEACDEEVALRSGLMLHIDALMCLVRQNDKDA